MARVRLIIEYKGTGFHGWQEQDGLRTIQSELTKTVRMILRTETSALQSSGRTDAGVHARAQVVTFDVEGEPDLKRLAYAVSNIYRGEISVLQADFVDPKFHPRFNAKSKQYSYQILNLAVPAVFERGFVWHVPVPLNSERMHQEAQSLVGTHDFSSFRSKDCWAQTTTKTIFECAVEHQGDRIEIRVIGAGFLKQMVRIIVGTLVDFERGRLKLESISAILAAKDRRVAGVTAPAYGLTLDWVGY